MNPRIVGALLFLLSGCGYEGAITEAEQRINDHEHAAYADADHAHVADPTLVAELDALLARVSRLEAELGGTAGAQPSDGLTGSGLDVVVEDLVAVTVQVDAVTNEVTSARGSFASLGDRLDGLEQGGSVVGGRLDALEATVDAPATGLTDRLAAIDGGTLYGPGDLVSAVDDNAAWLLSLDGRVGAIESLGISAGDVVAWSDAVAWGDHAAVGYVERIQTDTVFPVSSSGYSDINAALEALDGYAIDSDATVTIQVDTTSATTYTETIAPTHPNGDRIQIVGDLATPIPLTFDGVDGVLLTNGNTLGLLDGFVIEGTGGATTGVSAQWGGVLRMGTEMEVRDFVEAGVSADHHATIDATGVDVLDNGTNGVEAVRASYVQAAGVIATGQTTGSGRGLLSRYHSLLSANGATLNGNTNGLRSDFGSTAVCNGCVVENNGNNGLEAVSGGGLEADGSSSNGNASTGYIASRGSWMSVVGANANGNSRGLAADGLSSVQAVSFVASNNSGDAGAVAGWGAYLNISSGTTTNNAGSGVVSGAGAIVLADGLTSSGNGGSGDIAFDGAAIVRATGFAGTLDGPTSNSDPAYAW